MPLNFDTNLILQTSNEGSRLETIKRVTGAWFTAENRSEVFAITGSATLKGLLLPGQIFYVRDTNEMLIYSQSGAFPFTNDHFNSFTWPGSGGSASTGSLLTTASVAGTTMTFTKGDSSTFDVTLPGGSGGTPGGSPGQIQFNSAGAFAGDAKLSFNSTTGLTKITGSLKIEALNGSQNIFLIKSGSREIAKVTDDGTFVLSPVTGSALTPYEGGLMYSSSALYVGTE